MVDVGLASVCWGRLEPQSTMRWGPKPPPALEVAWALGIKLHPAPHLRNCPFVSFLVDH